MNLLSADERSALIKALHNAPDEVLIDAVRQVKDHHGLVKNSFKEVQGFIGLRITEAPAPRYAAPAPEAVPSPPAGKGAGAAPRPNTNPGRSSISKIGANTKAEILKSMEDHDMSPDYGNSKWTEHLKLLHNRGEVKFDGKVFYL